MSEKGAALPHTVMARAAPRKMPLLRNGLQSPRLQAILTADAPKEGRRGQEPADDPPFLRRSSETVDLR